MKKLPWVFLVLFLLGAGVRAINVWHPADRSSWRECDEAGIARNFYREGMNIFYPRVDWRGDTPGYAEMEFPLFPWLTAVLYKIFGYQEYLGRVVSFTFSLLTLGVFFLLARYLLPNVGAITAAAFFTFNPIFIYISNSLQPESIMFFFYLLAAYCFLRWYEEDKLGYFWISCAATALTILSKATAAHLGIFFALLVIHKYGWKVFIQFRLWIFAFLALIPNILWYLHSHHFWLQYGNSLGVSNEYHWIGFDFFTNKEFIVGIMRNEILYALMPTGIILILAGIYSGFKTKVVTYSLFWLIAVYSYYFIASRTTGDQWAFYYHIASIPAFSLLMGNGVVVISKMLTRQNLIYLLSLVSTLLAIPVAALAHYKFSGNLSQVAWVVSLALISTALASLFLKNQTSLAVDNKSGLVFGSILAYLLLFGLCGTLLFESRQIVADAKIWSEQNQHDCVEKFAQLIPREDLILVTGGICRDDDGYPVAYNASFMFLWMDRKGFNVCIEEQSLEVVSRFAKRGAKYYLVAKKTLQPKKAFEKDLLRVYPLQAQCEDYYLFKLTPHSFLE